MKQLLLTLAFLGFAAAPALAKTDYSAVIDDLPLMQGMVEHAEEATIFDTPAGRIVEVTVTTSASGAAVQKFYAESLPPLGWEALSATQFTRDGEFLTMNIAAHELRLTLTPHP